MPSLESYLEECNTVFAVLDRDPDIVEILSRYGYDAVRNQEGKALYQNVKQLTLECKHLLISIDDASDALQTERGDAQVHLQVNRQIARTALKGHSLTRYTLDLRGPLARSYDLSSQQARSFYFAFREFPELQTIVQPFGLTIDRVDAGIQGWQSLDEQHRVVRSLEEQLDTKQRQRDEAFDALKEWMSTFRKIATVGLAKYPAFLARLGFQAKARTRTRKLSVAPTQPLPSLPPSEPPLEGRPSAETESNPDLASNI